MDLFSRLQNMSFCPYFWSLTWYPTRWMHESQEEWVQLFIHRSNNFMDRYVRKFWLWTLHYPQFINFWRKSKQPNPENNKMPESFATIDIFVCQRCTKRMDEHPGVSIFMIARWEHGEILVAFAFISHRCKKLFPITELYTCKQLLRDEGEYSSFIHTDWQKFFPVSFYIPLSFFFFRYP